MVQNTTAKRLHFAKPPPKLPLGKHTKVSPLSSIPLSENPEFAALSGRVTALEHTSDRIEKKVHTIQGDLGGMSGLLQLMAANTLGLAPEEIQRRQHAFQQEALKAMDPEKHQGVQQVDKHESQADTAPHDGDAHMGSTLGKRTRDVESKWGIVKITPLKYAVKKVEVLRAHTSPDNVDGFRIKDVASGFEQWLPMEDLFDSEDEATKSLATRSRHTPAQESTQPGASSDSQ